MKNCSLLSLQIIASKQPQKIKKNLVIRSTVYFVDDQYYRLPGCFAKIAE